MQPLERAVAIFCIACICAELTTQLAGSTWARRCIKAVAGLYILVVFARPLPKAGAQLQAFSMPQAQPAFFGTLDALIASEAARLAEEAGEAVP